MGLHTKRKRWDERDEEEEEDKRLSAEQKAVWNREQRGRKITRSGLLMRENAAFRCRSHLNMFGTI